MSVTAEFSGLPVALTRAANRRSWFMGLHQFTDDARRCALHHARALANDASLTLRWHKLSHTTWRSSASRTGVPTYIIEVWDDE